MKRILLPLLLATSLFASSQIDCLTEAIYFEARGSSYADQAAVADVILNRVESSRYPNTVCKVVHQAKLWKGNPIRNKCQFSYFCDGRSDSMKDLDAYESAKLLAVQVLVFKAYRGLTEGSLFYYADYIKPPYWAKSYQFVSTIGSHKFYRLKD